MTKRGHHRAPRTTPGAAAGAELRGLGAPSRTEPPSPPAALPPTGPSRQPGASPPAAAAGRDHLSPRRGGGKRSAPAPRPARLPPARRRAPLRLARRVVTPSAGISAPRCGARAPGHPPERRRRLRLLLPCPARLCPARFGHRPRSRLPRRPPLFLSRPPCAAGQRHEAGGAGSNEDEPGVQDGPGHVRGLLHPRHLLLPKYVAPRYGSATTGTSTGITAPGGRWRPAALRHGRGSAGSVPRRGAKFGFKINNNLFL